MGDGYRGQVLRVNLTTGQIAGERPRADVYRKYLGGKGLAAHYLLTEVRAGAGPLGPENKLVFATSVVAGAPIPGFARFVVAAKSPVTGGYGESEAGGSWALELKRAGFDAVIIEGRAEQPVYLWIKDGAAELRSASSLWGTSPGQAEAAIRTELDNEGIAVAAIGPGGENQVRFACILQGRLNAAGRGGLGAVMGAKGLKAVAVRGTGSLAFHDPARVQRLADRFRQPQGASPAEGCCGCPFRCKRVATGSERDTAGAATLDRLCNEAGLDLFATAEAVAHLSGGSGEAVRDLVGLIVRREGIGATLAEGARMGAGAGRKPRGGHPSDPVARALSVCLHTVAPRGPLSSAMLVDALYGITGWEVTPQEIARAGEQAANLAVAFDYREGLWTRFEGRGQGSIAASAAKVYHA